MIKPWIDFDIENVIFWNNVHFNERYVNLRQFIVGTTSVLSFSEAQYRSHISVQLTCFEYWVAIQTVNFSIYNCNPSCKKHSNYPASNRFHHELFRAEISNVTFEEYGCLRDWSIKFRNHSPTLKLYTNAYLFQPPSL